MTKEQFINYLQGHCTEEEFEQVLEWIREGSASAQSKAMVEELWKEFEPGEPGERTKYNRILDKIHQEINLRESTPPVAPPKVASPNRVLTYLTRVAAILLFPVLTLLLINIYSDHQQFAENTSDLELEAPAGSRMNFVLGDGTRVWLNHGSKLRIPSRFEGKSREVFLSGEAYFEVATNKDIPFIVQTSHLEVKATGTEFNVSAYAENDRTETTLVEGKVIVYRKSDHREIKELSPNECLKFDTGKNESLLESGNTEKYVAWKNGLLVFKNDPIDDIARKLAKWYNVDVEILDEAAKDHTCTATFTDETLGQVLELMSLPTPVYFELSPRKKAPDGSFIKQKIFIGLKDSQQQN